MIPASPSRGQFGKRVKIRATTKEQRKLRHQQKRGGIRDSRATHEERAARRR